MNNKIKEFRQAQGLSQEELSIKSGVSRPTISMIETNTLDNIESKTMLKLAKALNCDIGDIFFKENVVFAQQKENQEG
jgi:DNA-binding XRE family transcriptional regulator